MDRHQSENQPTEKVEEEEEQKAAKISGWTTFLGAVASGLVPVAMSYGLIQQLRTSMSFENLVLFGVLVILLAFLVTVSIRQRYNERIYLRLWQARLERQRERELRRRAQMGNAERNRSKQDSRAGNRSDPEPGTSDASFEERLLQSLGMEPSP